jgi:hypothetical protein
MECKLPTPRQGLGRVPHLRVAVCELQHPPAITETMLTDIFGRIPGTQNPPAISDLEFTRLQHLAHGI